MRYVYVLLLLIVISIVIAPAQVHHKPKKKTHKSSAKSLKKKLSSVRAKRSQVTGELKQTRRQVKLVKVDLDNVDHQLDHLERRLDVTVAELGKDRRRQKELAKLLEQDQALYAGRRQEVRRVIRSMYEQGSAPSLSILLKLNSSGDLASRAFLAQRVMKADSDVLQSYKDLVGRITNQKAEADAVLRQIRQREQDQKQEQSDLQDTRSAKAQTLEELQSKKQELQKILDQLDRDEAAIEQEILASLRRSGSTGRPRTFSGRLLQPVDASPGSPFGMRFHPIFHEMRLHAGQDFPAPTGTPIHAAAGGVVVNAQYMRGFGNCVILDHGGGIATVYGHCSRILVSAGQHVERGEHIANVGATGYATGAHLHFEVRVKGKPVNPMRWLR